MVELKRLNLAAWNGEHKLKLASSLDSSLKKNTAFIKKARIALNAENLPSLLSDVENLSLEKYISEVVSAVVEGLGKVKGATDIAAAVQIVCALHQRFTSQFTPFLAFQLVRGLAPPPASYLNSLSPEQREKEEATRVLRQRSSLRIVTELWLVKVIRSVQDALDGSGADPRKKRNDHAVPLFCLRELLGADRDYTNLPIPVTFVKNYSWILNDELDPDLVTPPEVADLRLVLGKYFEGLYKHLIQQSQVIAKELRRFDENTLAFGSVSTTREAQINDMQRAHEKQIASAQVLADALALEMPNLQSNDEDSIAQDSIIRGVGNVNPGDDLDPRLGIWEDEEQKRFYENLVDLKEVVPSDLLSDGKVIAPVAEDLSDSALESAEASFDDADLEEEPSAVEEETEPVTASIGAKLGALLLRLPELNNKELIDNASIEFAFLNSKPSRNRLIRLLLDVPASRIDILPYYARFIATLSKYLPTIAERIVDALHRDCRRYVKGRGLSKDVPLRTCNIRYISELVKFRMVPLYISLHCYKILVESFSKNDVEVLAVMMESCGRFLLRAPESSAKMQGLLEIINRKAKNVSGMERSVIENAFYYVNPPEHTAIPQKERLPIDLYIRKLTYKDLNAKNYDKILRQLKKLDWNDEHAYKSLTSVFTKIWKIKFASIQYIAVLLSGLAKTHPVFAMEVIDSVVENIRFGLEENRFRENQKRIATVKYLGELYNYKQIDAILIFDTLYLLISLGHPGGRPTPAGCPLDMPQDFFRIRLVLTLLDTCGNCFNTGAGKKKLDVFLAFFQFYIRTKINVPLDVEFGVIDTFSHLRPNIKLVAGLEEAAALLDEALRQSMTVVDTNDADQDAESDENEDEEISERIAREIDDDGDDASVSAQEAGEEEEFVLLEKKKMQDDLDREAEDELSRELGKMMSESSELRKSERNRVLDIVLPRRNVSNGTAPPVNGAETQSNAVAFTFLSKRGKPKSLNLPSNSALVISNSAQRAAELQEKEAIKNLVIKYETSYAKDELVDASAKSGVAIKYTPQMLAGQRGGQRSGSMFRMGTQRQRRTDVKDEE